jgi:hypothetical protein
MAQFIKNSISTAPSTMVTSYHGSFEFLDSQAGFDDCFPKLKLLGINQYSKEPMLTSMKSFSDQCGLYAHLRAFSEDYVGTVDAISFEAINNIGETLRSYKMEYSIHGKQYTVAQIDYTRSICILVTCFQMIAENKVLIL